MPIENVQVLGGVDKFQSELRRELSGRRAPESRHKNKLYFSITNTSARTLQISNVLVLQVRVFPPNSGAFSKSIQLVKTRVNMGDLTRLDTFDSGFKNEKQISSSVYAIPEESSIQYELTYSYADAESLRKDFQLLANEPSASSFNNIGEVSLILSYYDWERQILQEEKFILHSYNRH